MKPLLLAGAALAWIVLGIAGAAVLARGNERRGVRRIPAVERRIGLVYLAGVLLGPAAPVVAVALLGLLPFVDAADARAEERARAAKFAARRAAREEGESSG
jgi:hypothetical protein